jgi:DNA topoisomerase VI subunit B
MDALPPLPDFDALRRALEEAHEVAEVAGIRDQAIALETHARRRARNTEAKRKATEIQLCAMRKAGQLLLEAGKAGLRGTGRPTKGAKVGTATALPKLKDYGIGRHESQRWQKLAKVPQDKFEAALADMSIMPTMAGMLRLIAGPKSNPRKGGKRSVSIDVIRDDERAHRAKQKPAFELAKSTSSEGVVFTNCGKADPQETPAKPIQKKLTRVPFTVSRLMEFCNKRELVNQTGHDVSEWPLVILKELVDNALDAAEEAEIAPIISIAVKRGLIVIEDNGPGIPAKTIDGVLDYSIRVSSREAYVSPTRGAQGNALKSLVPMAYVMDDRRGEDTSGKTIIEAHGLAHHITFAVDHIRQEPRIGHTTEPSPVVRGTRITVNLPTTLVWEGGYHEVDCIEYCKPRFLELAEAYAWLNPHLTILVSWDGEAKIDANASNPTWDKWLPSWPTSAHWYDRSRFRRYMAAHIANRGDITIREFVSEFAGMSATAKQKAILLETGASHVSLHDFFGRKRANGDNIAKLLTALQKHSKPIPPAHLGIIGKAHLYRMMEAAGGDPKTFTYNRSDGETNGVPRMVEFAFGIHRDGLTAGHGPSRKFITGVNWSPGINNPFRQLGRSGEGLDSILAEVRANTSQPVIAALHLACPRVTYTDRGKSAIVVEGDARGSGDDEE